MCIYPFKSAGLPAALIISNFWFRIYDFRMILGVNTDYFLKRPGCYSLRLRMVSSWYWKPLAEPDVVPPIGFNRKHITVDNWGYCVTLRARNCGMYVCVFVIQPAEFRIHPHPPWLHMRLFRHMRPQPLLQEGWKSIADIQRCTSANLIVLENLFGCGDKHISVFLGRSY